MYLHTVAFILGILFPVLKMSSEGRDIITIIHHLQVSLGAREICPPQRHRTSGPGVLCTFSELRDFH